MEAEGGCFFFFSSGATVYVAFADSCSLNPLYAVMVSNSEIVDEL